MGSGLGSRKTSRVPPLVLTLLLPHKVLLLLSSAEVGVSDEGVVFTEVVFVLTIVAVAVAAGITDAKNSEENNTATNSSTIEFFFMIF
jgi:hypothetical protein